MIAIGLHFGGPELRQSKIQEVLNRATRTAEAIRLPNSTDGAEGWINPIFIVPGSIYQPDFEGYEIGYFSKKQKGLVVKIAVPVAVASGQDIALFVGRALRETVLLAAAHFTSKRMSFSTLAAEKIIIAIEAALAE